MSSLPEIVNGSVSQDGMRRRGYAGVFEQFLFAAVRGMGSAGRGIQATATESVALYGRYRLRQRKRTAIQELNALSDYMLSDIGLHRGEIPDAVGDLYDNEERTNAIRSQAPQTQVPQSAVSESRSPHPHAKQPWRRVA